MLAALLVIGQLVRPFYTRIPGPSITVLGVCRVPVTDQLFAQAMDWKYGGIDLSPEERRQAEQAVREELSSAVLIECEVRKADENFDVGDFRQPDSDQAAYHEAFLTPDGSALL